MLWPREVPLQPSGSQGSPGSCEQRSGERDFVLDLVFPKVRLGFAGCCGLGPSSLDVGWSICLHFFGLWIMTFTEFFSPTEGCGLSAHRKTEKGETGAGLRGREDLGPHESNTVLLALYQGNPFQGHWSLSWVDFLPPSCDSSSRDL